MCSASTRWVQYSVDAVGTAGTGGGVQGGTGYRGYSLATGASDTDTFNIAAGNNRLHMTIDTDTSHITLASGVDLDPRFVARDISEKLHNLSVGGGYDQASCVWENGKLKLYSGSLGTSSLVTVISGANTAHLELGWGGTNTEPGGSSNNPATSPAAINQFNGIVTVSGTYNGLFDEVYTVVATNAWTVSDAVRGGSNPSSVIATTGNIFNWASDIEYVINIDITGGTTMGGGTGGVPKMSWTSTGSADDNAAGVELLYADYFYALGTKGTMIKFSDGVFNSCPVGTPAWTVTCTKPLTTQGSTSQGAVGDAMYQWGSSRGDDSGNTSVTTSSGTYTRLGSKGLYIRFDDGDNMLLAGDQFTVICTGPQPQGYGITNLDYGNVTVSTESALRCVMFEIVSGAVSVSSVKFGLQSHGSFSHHNENNSDTYFRFGTVGPDNATGSSPVDGLEWRADVVASDISGDSPPGYLYAVNKNLSVVTDADTSEVIGANSCVGMTSDPMWLNVKLGTSEVGANSTINFRVFFDYS